jgi:hydroxyacylglutathione hydrolase
MNVFVVPMLDDNFGYYVYRSTDIQRGFFVDASESEKVEEFMKALGIENLTHLLTTHKHWDHSGGNNDLKAKFPHLEVIGGAPDSIPSCT